MAENPLDLTKGVFQSDLIIQTAIAEGMRRLRNEDAWALNYVFSGLKNDALTNQQHGQAEIDAAIKWFRATQIPVFVNTRIDSFRSPCITIAIQGSTEVENTLADVNYNPEDLIQAPQSVPALSPVFTPIYDKQTGLVTLPWNLNTDFFYENMYLVNKAGTAYKIITVNDQQTLNITPGPVVDLTNVTLQSTPQNQYKVQMGSIAVRETATLGVHNNTDVFHTIVLHSILVFILLRYRKSLFEARGLERTKFSSTDLLKSEEVQGEMASERYVNIEWVARHFFPVDMNPIAQGVNVVLDPIDNSATQLVIDVDE